MWYFEGDVKLSVVGDVKEVALISCISIDSDGRVDHEVLKAEVDDMFLPKLYFQQISDALLEVFAVSEFVDKALIFDRQL